MTIFVDGPDLGGAAGALVKDEGASVELDGQVSVLDFSDLGLQCFQSEFSSRFDRRFGPQLYHFALVLRRRHVFHHWLLVDTWIGNADALPHI